MDANEAKVKERWPDAECRNHAYIGWRIHALNGCKFLSDYAPCRDAAWAKAYDKLRSEEVGR